MKQREGDEAMERGGEEKEMCPPRLPVSLSPRPVHPSSLRPHPLEDYYLEGAAVVFTALYHRRRGYCCGSGCRHCPYAFEEARGDVREEVSVDEKITGA